MEAQDFWNARFVQYDSQARLQFDRATTIVGVGLTVLVTLVGVVVAYNRFEVLLTVPVTVVILWAVATRMLHEYLWLSLYRDEAEKQLFQAMQVKAGTQEWHGTGGRSLREGAPNAVLTVVVIVASLASVSVSLWLVALQVPQFMGAVLAVGCASAVGFAAVGVAWSAGGTEIREAYMRLAKTDGQRD